MTKEEGRQQALDRLQNKANESFVVFTASKNELSETHSCDLSMLVAAQRMLDRIIDGMVFPKRDAN